MRCIVLAVNINLVCAVNQKLAHYWLIRFTVHSAHNK